MEPGNLAEKTRLQELSVPGCFSSGLCSAHRHRTDIDLLISVWEENKQLLERRYSREETTRGTISPQRSLGAGGGFTERRG